VPPLPLMSPLVRCVLVCLFFGRESSKTPGRKAVDGCIFSKKVLSLSQFAKQQGLRLRIPLHSSRSRSAVSGSFRSASRTTRVD
jgi:hypothetical protein